MLTTVISCAGGPSEGDAIVTCLYSTIGVRVVTPAPALMRGCVARSRMQHAGTAAMQASSSTHLRLILTHPNMRAMKTRLAGGKETNVHAVTLACIREEIRATRPNNSRPNER